MLKLLLQHGATPMINVLLKDEYTSDYLNTFYHDTALELATERGMLRTVP